MALKVNDQRPSINNDDARDDATAAASVITPSNSPSSRVDDVVAPPELVLPELAAPETMATPPEVIVLPPEVVVVPPAPVGLSKLAWLSLHELTIGTIEFVHAGAVVVKESIYGWTPETDAELATIVAETPATIHHPPMGADFIEQVQQPVDVKPVPHPHGYRVPLTHTVSTAVEAVEERFHDTADAARKTLHSTLEHAEKTVGGIENHVRHVVHSVAEDAMAVTHELQAAIADIAEEARQAAVHLQEDVDRALNALHAPGITREERSRIEREIEAARLRMRSPSPPRRAAPVPAPVESRHPVLDSIGATSAYIHDGLAAVANMVTGRSNEATAPRYDARRHPLRGSEGTSDVDGGIVPPDALHRAWEAQWPAREAGRDVSDAVRELRGDVDRSQIITKSEDIVHQAVGAASHVASETVEAGKDLLAGSARDVRDVFRDTSAALSDRERALHDHSRWRSREEHEQGGELPRGSVQAEEPLGKDVVELLSPRPLRRGREQVQG
jgi:hypothetical protein